MVRWTYDANAGALYIYLADGTPDHQVELPDGCVVDIASDGSTVGIEMLSLSRPVLDEEFLDRFGIADELVPLLDAVMTAQLPVVLNGKLPPMQPDTAESEEVFRSQLQLALT